MKVLLDDIKVGDRMRVDEGDVNSLMESLKQLGQIVPISIDKDKNLIAGGRRYAAFTRIRDEYHSKIAEHRDWETSQDGLEDQGPEPPVLNLPFNPEEIEAYYIEDEDDISNKIREYEENAERKDFSWQEDVVSCYKLHSMYVEKAKQDGLAPWGTNKTAARMGRAPSWLRINLQIARLCVAGDPDILDKSTRFAAIQHLKDKKETEAQKELMKRIQKRRGEDIDRAFDAEHEAQHAEGELDFDMDELASEIEREEGRQADMEDIGGDSLYSMTEEISIKPSLTFPRLRLYHDDAISVMRKLPDGILDAIVTDPPFGIDLEKVKTSDLHAGKIYEDPDTKDSYEDLMFKFIPQSYRLLRDGGHMYVFFAPQFYELLYTAARQAGFKTYQIPLIWHRLGGGQTMNPDQYPASCYEMCMYCFKNNVKMYKKGQSNVLPYEPINARDKIHPAEKPAGLWEDLVSRTLPKDGDPLVADFFAGVGSFANSIVNTGEYPYWRIISVEKDEQYFLRQVARFEFVEGMEIMKNG